MVTLKNYDVPELRRLDVAHHLPPHRIRADARTRRGEDHHPCARAATSWTARARDPGWRWPACGACRSGYGRKELAEAAYRADAASLPYYNTFFKTAPPPTIELAAKIAACCGDDLTARLLQQLGLRGERHRPSDGALLLAREGPARAQRHHRRENAYHGSTIAGASLGGMKPMHGQGGPWFRASPTSGSPTCSAKASTGPGRVRRARGRALEAADPGDRPGECRRLHRRAGAGCGRRDHPAEIYWPRVEGSAANTASFWSATR